MKKTVIRVIIIIAALAVTGLYLFDILYSHTPYSKNLLKFICVLCVLAAAFIRTVAPKSRRSLAFYEENYIDDIGDAFNGSILRKKLLCALRLYNENNFRKSVKYLEQLLPECRNSKEEQVILLFLALNYTDMGCHKTALEVYDKLLEYDCNRSRMYNNMGYIHMQDSEYETAVEYFKKALVLDSENAYSYANIASCNFNLGDYDEAIDYAETALEKKPGFRQPTTLLAILYHLVGNAEKSARYFQMAVSAGEEPDVLRNAIRNYSADEQKSED